MKRKVIFLTSILCILIICVFFMYWQKNSKAKMETNKTNNSATINSSTSSNVTSGSSLIDSNISNEESNSTTNLDSNSNTNSATNTNSSTSTSNNVTSNKTSNTNKNSNVTKPLTAAEQIDKDLKEMTLDEKIGQLLIVNVSGKSMSDSTQSMLKKYKPGGVILMGENLGNYQTTINFIDAIKKTNSIPLIVAVDQEGGTVQRLKSITGKKATVIPSMPTVGKKNDETLAYSLGTVMAEELRVFGFNMDFAPVLDVAIPGSYMESRCFGTDADIVAKLGVSLARGIESKGVIPVYKHFPGHGSTFKNSHNELPILSKTKAELYDVDLLPFQMAIQNDAKVIMIGHLAIPNITTDNTPASLSKVLITDLLKKEMGYKGLVITDALNMGALTKNYTEKQIYELAINAGVDILLMPKSAESAIKYIKQSIKEGKIKESQINESVRKILTLKYATMKTDKLSTSYLGSKVHQELVNKINQ